MKDYVQGGTLTEDVIKYTFFLLVLSVLCNLIHPFSSNEDRAPYNVPAPNNTLPFVTSSTN